VEISWKEYFDPKCETKGKIIVILLLLTLMKTLEANIGSIGNRPFDPIGSKYK
jgi:hypothetical protein